MADVATSPVVSLFSGAMGLDLGLEQADIRTSLAVEVDPFCCSTIRKNRPAIDVWETDIRQIDGKSIRAGKGNRGRFPDGRRAAVSELLSGRQKGGPV